MTDDPSWPLDGQAPGFVLAAVTICAVSAWMMILMSERAEHARGRARLCWSAAVATVAGIGVWTTHFVAMLGYRTDIALSYDPATTLASAAIAIAAVGIPFASSTNRARAWSRVAAGAASGLGIGAMHVTGMAALEGCGRTQSILSEVLACSIGASCMAVACARPKSSSNRVAAGTLIVTAVCGTHFAALGGSEVTGARLAPGSPGMQVALSVLAATGAAVLFCAAFLALATARRFEVMERAHADALATALQNMSNGILKVSVREVVELYNRRLCSMLNLAPESMFPGISLAAFLERTGRANGWDDDRIARILANHRGWMATEGETRVEHHFDDGRILSISCQPVSGGAVLTFDDVTRVRRAQLEVTRLAYHDPLTGLPNRRSLMERLAAAAGPGRPLALLLIDLDRFKAVNDTFGHGVGDRLLVHVAARLQAFVGDAGFVARLGGDEMAALVPDDATSTAGLADRIVAGIEEPFAFGDVTVAVGCSIGVSELLDGSGPEDAMRRADIALYEAKRLGRGRTVRYAPDMIDAVAERHRLEGDIRAAIAEGQFRLACQPIVSLPDRRVVGFEASLRWAHPTRGVVPPAAFVPLAEETGLIVPIGRWFIQEACRRAAAWPVEQHVVVNVSAVQLRSPAVLLDVATALAESGLAPNRLELVLTEMALVADWRPIAGTLSALRGLGVRVAVGDLGMVRSALERLSSLPIDRIKIDGALVASAPTDRHARAVVKAIAQIGRIMGIPTLAEGVEDDERLDLMNELGCQAAVGYALECPERRDPFLVSSATERAA